MGTFDHLQLLIFLESMLSRKEFIEHLFMSNKGDIKPIESAIRFCNSLIVKHLFDKKEVQDKYKNNDPMKFRLCESLFVYNSNPHITDYVLSALQINKEEMIKMLSYRCPLQPGYSYGNEAQAYHNFAIIPNLV